MEGIYFYWFSWLGWVVLTFLMKKSRMRTIISLVLLLLIITSTKYITMFNMTVSFAVIVLLTACYFTIGGLNTKRKYYCLLSSLIISIAFVSFHLLGLFDPVWIVFERKFMLALVVVYLTLLLHKDKLYRIVIASIGVCQGEIMYALILQKYQFILTIGSLEFLDSLSLTILILFLWNVVEAISSSLEQYIQRKNGRRAGMNP